jgi:hypothetical protein
MLPLLATSFSEPGKFSFYNVVLFIHIASAIVAFGVTFAYPIIGPIARREFPQSLPFVHAFQHKIGQRLITPAATLLLLAGIYLAAEGPYDFGDGFVSAGLAIIVILLGLGGAFFSPHEGRAAALAERDLAAAREGPVQFSDEYLAVARRIATVGAGASLLVLVAVFLMVIKPGV